MAGHNSQHLTWRKQPALLMLLVILGGNWIAFFIFSMKVGGDAMGILPSSDGFIVKSHGAITHVSEDVWLAALIYPLVTLLVTPLLAVIPYRLAINRRRPLFLAGAALVVLWSIAWYGAIIRDGAASIRDYVQWKSRHP